MIDKFNSIQLKILPFYPNPPQVHDWQVSRTKPPAVASLSWRKQVPLALINLKKRIEPNWDLTMVKVGSLLKRACEPGGSRIRFVMLSTGYPTYPASRLSWTATSNSRDKQSHISCSSEPLLHSSLPIDPRPRHYQVIMMTEIFQYSNMYTLRRSIQWLADESNVYEECGPYVTLPGTRSLWILSHRLT